MAGVFGGFGASTDNPNPTHFISQAAGIALQACRAGQSLLKIHELAPTHASIQEFERRGGLSSMCGSAKWQLSPPSETEDPIGGMVPIYERKQYAVWFSQRPSVKSGLKRFSPLVDRFWQAIVEFCDSPGRDRAIALQKAIDRLESLSQDLAQAVAPSAAVNRTQKPQLSDAGGNDLVTLVEIARLARKSVKTIRQKRIGGQRVLPKADVAGGGKGSQARWQYSRIRDPINSAFPDANLPEWREAKVLLSR